MTTTPSSRALPSGLPSTLPVALQTALLAADVPDQTLYLAGEIARWAPALETDQRVAWEVLAVAALEAQRRGDTRLGLAAVALRPLLGALGVPPAAQDAAVALAARVGKTPALGDVVGSPGDYKPFIVDGGHLYQQRTLAVETRLATALRARLARPAFTLTTTAGGDVQAALPSSLSDEQRAAVRAALERPLTVITGGPGTGKTSVILAVLRAAAALGLHPDDVALAAPTGKAANRINESLAARAAGAGTSLSPVAQTLHRLLGFRPAAGDFRHHRNHRLPHALVLVDESSMIDLTLMERLAGAVRDDARLVLLGDADQLPSVEAGAVFHDLLPLAVRLTRSYRMDPATETGRAILTAATAVRDGDAGALAPLTRARPGDVVFAGVELCAPGGGASASSVAAWLGLFLDRWYGRLHDDPTDAATTPVARRTFRFTAGVPVSDDLPALAAAYAQAHRQRILCVTRGAARPTGAAAINAALHRRALARQRGEASTGFLPGEPVLMSRNDYDRGLFNGDLGLCVRIDHGTGNRGDDSNDDDSNDDDPAAGVVNAVAFPQGTTFRAFPLASLQPDLELAYALTVHRAQGSELDAVALVLPSDELPLSSRELVYTALTRARSSVTILGTRPVLDAALARRIQRSTGLGERLFNTRP